MTSEDFVNPSLDELKSIRFELRLTPTLVARIDQWRLAHVVQISRAEAIRRLLSTSMTLLDSYAIRSEPAMTMTSEAPCHED